MSEFTLDAAELAFLLTMVDARGIPGVELAFPAGSDAHDAFLMRGAELLAANGHMKIEGGQFFDMHPALPLAAATLAAPEQIIHTTAYSSAGELHAGHYISGGLPVEFYILPDNRYRLVALDDVETAVGRIAHNLGLDPNAEQSAWTHTIPHERLAHERDLLAAVVTAIEETGSEPTITRRVADALAAPHRRADIDLVRMANNDILLRHSALLFELEPGVSGLLYFDPTSVTTVTVPAAAGFTAQLLNGVRALQAVTPTATR